MSLTSGGPSAAFVDDDSRNEATRLLVSLRVDLVEQKVNPLVDGAHRHLKDPLLQICAGLGFSADQV